MKTRIFLTTFIFVLAIINAAGQRTIDLSGSWKVKLDETNELIRKAPDR